MIVVRTIVVFEINAGLVVMIINLQNVTTHKHPTPPFRFIEKSNKRLSKTTNEPRGNVPFYTWIYCYTYYKTVLKELDNNSIFIA